MPANQPKKTKKTGAVETGGAHPSVSQLLAAAALSTSPEALVMQVSCMLGIPDVRNARGLKQCHQNFGAISSTLDKMFSQIRAHPGGNAVLADSLATATIVIYGRIGEDISLRTRIFNDTHFLENAMALLSFSSSTSEATVIEILSNITRFQETPILAKVARCTPLILDYAQAQEAGIKNAVMGIVTRCTAAALVDDANPHTQAAALMFLPRVIRFSLDVVLLPASILLTLRNMGFFCFMMSRRLSTVFLSSPDVMDFLAASTRAKDSCTRCLAQSALLEMYLGSTTDTLPNDRSELQPIISGFKSSVVEAAEQQETLTALVRSFTSGDSGRSHSEFGHAFSELIQRKEPLVRKALQREMNMPNILRTCEAAVRRDGSGDITADILHLELLLSQKEEATNFARSCIGKHPSVAYFHYAMTITMGQQFEPVLIAEKGLQCRITTEFIRQELLYYVSHFLYHNLINMLRGDLDVGRSQTVNVLAKKAEALTRTFLKISPPDHHRMLEMTAIVTLLDLLMKGHTLTDGELQIASSKLRSTYDIARSTGSVQLPRECLALGDILARVSSAWGRWGPTMSRYTGGGMATTPLADDRVDEYFVAWLKKLDEATPESLLSEIHRIDPGEGRYGPAQLHKCSACDKPSAALKRCEGCQKARYCNDVCQRAHWKVHRKACKASKSLEGLQI
ncbi:hypothetical protein FB45DRAFT_397054 [Roridomyces roridus]|uniref:MYND-type domain-containing protein n=1 Tax=Roridomyces roridus TaxID=1738132 RepID=A0AAD7FQP6_9AGAR|nr:hypothetical protein FB45DRAFT_397054 [Roridomyces roridus]